MRTRRFRTHLFVWFASAMALSLLAGFLVFQWRGRGSHGTQHAKRLRDFASHLVADVWDDPARRNTVVKHIETDLDLEVELSEGTNPALCSDPWVVLPVKRAGSRLGTMTVCKPPWESQPHSFPWSALLGSVFVLWVFAGALARHLTRPVEGLTRAVGEFGSGKLGTRVSLGRYAKGEIAVLQNSFNRMAKQIETQIKGQRELLAAVSHEMRTPLGHLRAMVDVAREQPGKVSWDEIDREIVGADELVGQLLAHSRLEFNSTNKREIDLAELCHHEIERLGLDAGLLSTPTKAIVVEADATLVACAVSNLLRNATEHGGGVSKVSLSCDENLAQVWVDDEGPGFDDKELGHVFESFFRGDKRGGALGLGLSLVQRIAQAHGGSAHAKNIKPRGARVGFSLRTYKHPPST